MTGIKKKDILDKRDMGNDRFNPLVKIFLYWYFFIYISTQVFSYFYIFNRVSVILSESIFFIVILGFYKKDILIFLKGISFKSKTSIIIIVLLSLLFVQGFISAPSTTDSMVYHIPRVMYWMQEKTVLQDVIRNDHDFMPPFAEYILVQLYIIVGSDRFLFISQWLAYAMSIYLSGLIANKIGADQKTKQYIRLAVASLPIAVLQASSTQTDMVVAVCVLLSLYMAFFVLNNFSFKYLFLFGISLGLGSLVKTSFMIFATIPLGFLFLELIRKRLFLKIILILTSLFICLIIQIPYFSQNIRLYGNFFGSQVFTSGSVYTNEITGINATVSNLIKNIFVQLPLPFINVGVQNVIVQIHKNINLSVNDTRTTYENSVFYISQVLYPQEDVASNPFHLLVICIAGLYLLRYLHRNKFNKTIIIYILAVVSFIVFSAVLKWQQQHSRLEIPFFIIGTIMAIRILMANEYGKKIVRIFLFISIPFVLVLIFLNIARPYVSYKPFYGYVQQFAPPLSVVPESFFIRPRDEQYFNARYYWFGPYIEISKILAQDEGIKFISFKFMDNFEYPFWVMLQNQGNDIRVIPVIEYQKSQYLISTTTEPYQEVGYKTVCRKTPIEYGYACLSKKLIQ